MTRTPKTRRSAESGIALLAVLLAVALLSMLVLVLSGSVQLELRAATYRKEAAQAYALACGGIEAALAELAYPRTADEAKSPLWAWTRGQREASFALGSGRVELTIVNETGKLDLNSAGPEQLARLFEAHGVESRAARELAAAILHWRSPAGSESEAVRLDDYYRARGERPRHAAFASVEELLRVRSMTREILYGSVEVGEDGKIRTTSGVGQDLTVLNRSPQVNLNYASEAVLRSVPGLEGTLARAVVEERRRAPFQLLADVGRRLPVLLPDQALTLLTTSENETYSLQATGSVPGSAVRRTVRAVVQLKPAAGRPYRIVAWYDDAASERAD